MVCQIVDRQKDIVISYQKARQYLEMNQLINREELIDSNNQVSINYQEKNKKLVDSILEYTEYNFNNPELSLKNISQIFGLSTTYLGKIFKSIQGEAYSTYLTNYRLEKSKLALIRTTKAVNEIASEIGFTNSTYYATLFKNTYGITPTVFRSRHNK
jgi:YesN/AraC family two-component response regulator